MLEKKCLGLLDASIKKTFYFLAWSYFDKKKFIDMVNFI